MSNMPQKVLFLLDRNCNNAMVFHLPPIIFQVSQILMEQ